MVATRNAHSIERMDSYLHPSLIWRVVRGRPALKFRGECAVVISLCCFLPIAMHFRPLHLCIPFTTYRGLTACGLRTRSALKPQCVQEQDQNLLGGFFGGVTDGLGALGSTVMGSPPPMAASGQDRAAKAPAAP